MKTESSAGEKHFQRVMESPSESKFMKVFQELCKDDIHHHDRIKKYMVDVGELVETGGNKNRRILIAVDDESVANLLTTILSTEGEIDVAQNGREGLQQVRDNFCDLIISAVEMPIVDGLKFFSEAKVISPELNKRFFSLQGPLLQTGLPFSGMKISDIW